MFTGIVQGLVAVVGVEEDENLSRIELKMDDLASNIELGASVAVNGTCLTVTQVSDNGAVCFDIIKETLDTTNLGILQAGAQVNVERSFKVGDEVGGHIVSGHVTATATLSNLRAEGHDRVLTFKLADEWLRFVLHKGYIGVDGASITVSSVDREAGTFSISLIPETIERTTLGQLAIGDKVNVEVDSQTQTIVETIERVMQDPEMRNVMLQQATSGTSN
ncbi:MAG TPA: riboflavin synthase [Gammaproteobacteria bacterium]|nr:riboflavin synthase [Gammaproteobacteria bacterium]